MKTEMSSLAKRLYQQLMENLLLVSALFVIVAVVGLILIHVFGEPRGGPITIPILRDFLMAILFAGTAGLFYEIATRRRLALITQAAIGDSAEEAKSLMLCSAGEMKGILEKQLAKCKEIQGRTFASVAKALDDPEIASALLNASKIEVVGYTSATTQEAFLNENHIGKLAGKEVLLLVRHPSAEVPFLNHQPNATLARSFYELHRRQGIQDRILNYWQPKLREVGATLSTKFYDCSPFAAGFLIDRTIGVLELFRPEWKTPEPDSRVLDYAARPKDRYLALRVSTCSPYELQLLEYFRTWIDMAIQHFSKDAEDVLGKVYNEATGKN